MAATEVPEAVPREAGVISTDVNELRAGLRRLIDEPDEARAMGEAARKVAIDRFGLERFLADWDSLLEEVAP